MTVPYYAATPLCMHGKNYAVGDPIDPARVDPGRITAGLKSGKIVTKPIEQKAPASAAQPAKPDDAGKTNAKSKGGK